MSGDLQSLNDLNLDRELSFVGASFVAYFPFHALKSIWQQAATPCHSITYLYNQVLIPFLLPFQPSILRLQYYFYHPHHDEDLERHERRASNCNESP